MDMISELAVAQKKPKKTRVNPFKLSPMAWREARWGLFFISPWLIGFLHQSLVDRVSALLPCPYDRVACLFGL
jgi:hypothetical protein